MVSGQQAARGGAPVRMIAAAIASAMLLIATTVPAYAGDEAKADEWHFEVEPYLWAPSLGGSTSSGDEIKVTFSELLEDLNFTAQGRAKARYNKFSLFSDMLYLKITSKGGHKYPIPVNPGAAYPSMNAGSVHVTQQQKVSMKAWIVTTAGGYKLLDNERGTLNLHAGMRYTSIDSTATVSLSTQRRGKSVQLSATEQWYDAIFGASGDLFIDNAQKWYFRYYGDVGTGDTDLTWQIEGGIGHRISGQWDAYLGYRYLSYNFKSGSAISALNVSGPIFGAKYRF